MKTSIKKKSLTAMLLISLFATALFAQSNNKGESQEQPNTGSGSSYQPGSSTSDEVSTTGSANLNQRNGTAPDNTTTGQSGTNMNQGIGGDAGVYGQGNATADEKIGNSEGGAGLTGAGSAGGDFSCSCASQRTAYGLFAAAVVGLIVLLSMYLKERNRNLHHEGGDKLRM